VRPTQRGPRGDSHTNHTNVSHKESVAEEHLGPKIASHDPELASYLRIEERELAAGGRNYQRQAGPLESRLALIVELR
jgi:hypothetical protein